MKSAHQTAAWLCALTLSGVACIVLWQSLGNPIRADLAMLHYSGFLMQEKKLSTVSGHPRNQLPCALPDTSTAGRHARLRSLATALAGCRLPGRVVLDELAYSAIHISDPPQ